MDVAPETSRVTTFDQIIGDVWTSYGEWSVRALDPWWLVTALHPYTDDDGRVSQADVFIATNTNISFELDQSVLVCRGARQAEDLAVVVNMCYLTDPGAESEWFVVGFGDYVRLQRSIMCGTTWKPRFIKSQLWYNQRSRRLRRLARRR